jgi:hypothetical protein
MASQQPWCLSDILGMNAWLITNYFARVCGVRLDSKTFSRRWLVILFFGSVIIASVGCKKVVAASQERKASEAKLYTNAYFGFSLVVPPGWSASLPTNAASSDTLLFISEKPLGSKATSNPTLLVLAEKTSASGMRNAKDYLEHLTRMIPDSIVVQRGQTPIPYKKVGEVREVKAGTRVWDRVDLTVGVGERLVHQAYFATVINDYILTVIIAGITDAEVRRLEEIVATTVLGER